MAAEPEHAPLQPVNALPAAGAAVSATTVPAAKFWLHPFSPLQLMPAGVETTVPLPPTVTASESYCTSGVKDAPTLCAVLIVTVHVSAPPVQAPVHPTKAFPLAGEAVNVTAVPLAYDWLQVPALVQLIPEGLEVTEPAPPTVTWSVSIWTAGAKLAETLKLELTTTTQVGEAPEHAPLQPRKVWPEAGAAVRVTVVLIGNDWTQVFGPMQFSPAGLDVTVPAPPTATETVRSRACWRADAVAALDADGSPPPQPTSSTAPAHTANQRKFGMNTFTARLQGLVAQTE